MHPLVTQYHRLNDSEKAALISQLTDEEALDLIYDWSIWARPNQLAPDGDWWIWLLLAGRGFGKTASLIHFAQHKAMTMPGSRGIFSAPTAADVRDILVEGDSGILNAVHPRFRPVYQPSKRRLTWANGTIAILVSADEPDRFRGLQGHWAICDELAAWRRPEAFDMLLMGLRLGQAPQLAIATTPRPTQLIRSLAKNPEVRITKGVTQENIANLAPVYVNRIIAPYVGTRLGRQELNAEILEDTPGALWKQEQLDKTRVPQTPTLVRIVVAIDPAASAHEGSSETGIIVAGVDRKGHGYVLDDVSLKDSPEQWAQAAVDAYKKYEADRMIGEVNNGGDMVEAVIRSNDKTVSFKQVRASRGKVTRAEPVSALYEQGKVHHVGHFSQLESQITTWVPGEKSPDRMDALVWAITELMLKSGSGGTSKRVGYGGLGGKRK